MKNVSYLLVCCLASVFFTSCKTPSSTTPEFDVVKPLQEKWKPLPFSHVRPTGWLKDQMEKDLDGFVGNLDKLVPQLIINDDIYGVKRLTKKDKKKDVGAFTDGGEWDVQFLWWNSETQSNWWDGYLRHAVLLNDTTHLKSAEAYIQRILKSQDKDGYLGIYDAELRYNFTSENGELWAKATLLRGMLAWYEYTKEATLLNAIEQAVQDVMNHYPANQSTPFLSTKPDVGGVTHGLMIIDVFQKLYLITHQEKYRDYCIFLYKDFSSHPLNEDAQYQKLINDSLALQGHGAHSYEHLRAVATAYYATGNPALEKALQGFLKKISTTTTPAGGPIGDEWIGKRKAHAASTGYEYCSIHELMHGYTDLLQKTAQPEYAEKAELIFFNAAQGARDPNHSCIAYLKTDNSFVMTGDRNYDSTHAHQTRYQYSPTHQEAAVCCVPNAGRITPYYVEKMWMQDEEGFIATLLGPSEVISEWNNQPIRIIETTDYPSNFSFQFDVVTNNSNPFTLKIRKPTWARKIECNTPFIEKEGLLVFDKLQKKETRIEITFIPELSIHTDQHNDRYFTYGPMVLAVPIPSKEIKSKEFTVPGFADYQYTPLEKKHFAYTDKAINRTENSSALEFNAFFYNTITKKEEEVKLVPMGHTILRQVTFSAIE